CATAVLHFFLLSLPPPPRSTLFPYTTLFRSLMRASGAFFKNAMPNAGRPVKYCGFKPGAAGGVSKLTLTGGWSPSAAVPRRSQKDRKSTRLNSSHLGISYAVFCLKKKKKTQV